MQHFPCYNDITASIRPKFSTLCDSNHVNDNQYGTGTIPAPCQHCYYIQRSTVGQGGGGGEGVVHVFYVTFMAMGMDDDTLLEKCEND